MNPKDHDPVMTSKRRPKTFITSSTSWPGYRGSRTNCWLILKLFQKGTLSSSENSSQISELTLKAPPPKNPLRIVEQRPADAFPGLDDEQLKHHAFGTLEQFILDLSR